MDVPADLHGSGCGHKEVSAVFSVRVPSVLLVVALALGLVTALGGAAPARSPAPPPSVRLIAALEHTTVNRWDAGAPFYGDLGVYLAPVGGPLDLRARRTGENTFDVRQVVPIGGGVEEVRRLPSDTVASLSDGLQDFFEVTVSTLEGQAVERVTLPFCPQSTYSGARVNDTGPDVQRYRQDCWASEVTQAVVWGIDEGWATGVPSADGGGWGMPGEEEPGGEPIPDGTYDVQVAIAPRYRDLFAVEAAGAARTVRVTVVTEQGEEEVPEQEGPHDEARAHQESDVREAEPPDVQGSSHQGSSAQQVIPEVREDAHGLPDLAALPAWGLEAHHDVEGGGDYLVFAATVWNAGPGPLVVEGFRDPGGERMRAFQYFYTDGARTGGTEVGTLEFDDRDGHDHWHFTDFARYRLLDRDTREVVTSDKEAFCLAHTDAVDLTLPGASWQPGSVGLATACGWRTSLWSRQVLDAGWGDTYMQWTPGQSFDITDVPNGSYLVEVATNADRRLRERTMANNVALTRVRLGGTPGARTVAADGTRTPPGAPTDVTASAGNASASVSWSPPESDGGSPITGYTVAADPSGTTMEVDGDATTATITGLDNGTTYTFAVTATNASGTGPASPRSNPVTPAAEACAEAGFTDRDAIPAAHRGNVDCAAERDIVHGFPDGTYGPTSQVRRDQMASFIVRSLEAGGVDLGEPTGEPFTDVPDDSPHAEAIHRLAAAGIVQGGAGGRPETSYAPALGVRRDQMASFLLRAAAYAADQELASQEQRFADVGPGNPHFGNVNGAADAGLAAGFRDGTFRPGAGVRRDQMGTFVMRLFTYLDDLP